MTQSRPGLVEGKAALVTGPASGIERATALALAGEGAGMLLADMNDAEGEKTRALISERGGEARYLHVDVSREPDVYVVKGFRAQDGFC